MCEHFVFRVSLGEWICHYLFKKCVRVSENAHFVALWNGYSAQAHVNGQTGRKKWSGPRRGVTPFVGIIVYWERLFERFDSF